MAELHIFPSCRKDKGEEKRLNSVPMSMNVHPACSKWGALCWYPTAAEKKPLEWIKLSVLKMLLTVKSCLLLKTRPQCLCVHTCMHLFQIWTCALLCGWIQAYPLLLPFVPLLSWGRGRQRTFYLFLLLPVCPMIPEWLTLCALQWNSQCLSLDLRTTPFSLATTAFSLWRDTRASIGVLSSSAFNGSGREPVFLWLLSTVSLFSTVGVLGLGAGIVNEWEGEVCEMGKRRGRHGWKLLTDLLFMECRSSLVDAVQMAAISSWNVRLLGEQEH